jgi:hypothetical protein
MTHPAPIAALRQRAGAAAVQLDAFEMLHGEETRRRNWSLMHQHNRLLSAKLDADSALRVAEHEAERRVHIDGAP